MALQTVGGNDGRYLFIKVDIGNRDRVKPTTDRAQDGDESPNDYPQWQREDGRRFQRDTPVQAVG